jgi:hypothetical protein
MSFLIDIKVLIPHVTSGKFDTHFMTTFDVSEMEEKKGEVKDILLSAFQQRFDIQQVIGILLDIKIDQIILIESRSHIPDEPF